MCSKNRTSGSTGSSLPLERLRAAIDQADAVFLGAGSGASTAAGYLYSGERFTRYFSDFADKYGFGDMYSGGFCRFDSPEEQWAYWSRYVWINRYAPIPGPFYSDLLRLVKDRDYFVLTTNVDHCFQRAGFEKSRLFCTQGDYGLFQCSRPCRQQTWDNRDAIRQMVLSQGYTLSEDGTLLPPDSGAPRMMVPADLVPRCPHCGRAAAMNLRADDTFVQDAAWDAACERYERFAQAHQSGKVLYLEIGVGYNTPDIVKYNFWRQTFRNSEAVYACLNFDERQTAVPKEIESRSIRVSGDSAAAVRRLVENLETE